jgi:hypothetical protein
LRKALPAFAVSWPSALRVGVQKKFGKIGVGFTIAATVEADIKLACDAAVVRACKLRPTLITSNIGVQEAGHLPIISVMDGLGRTSYLRRERLQFTPVRGN